MELALDDFMVGKKKRDNFSRFFFFFSQLLVPGQFLLFNTWKTGQLIALGL